MKKIRLFMLALFLVLPVVFAPTTAGAVGGYHFTNFIVDVNLRENNVYDVTETCYVHYDSPLHGFYQQIPLKYNWDTPQGQKHYTAYVSNVQVSGAPYETYTQDGIYNIKIGDPNQRVTGDKVYTIKYSLDVGDDQISQYDFMYYNIVGTEWENTFDKVSFTIHMPKYFEGAVKAYSGPYGSTASNATIKVNETTITGSTTQPLGAYEGLSVYTQLPEGYFVGARTTAPYEIPLMILMGGLVLVGLILFIAFGRDGHAVQTVEFDAPDGMTSAEVGYVIDGSVDNKDAVSLVIYWADKGYLEIEERGKDDFVLRKKEDIPLNAKEFERTFFAGLFDGRDEVAVDDLKYTFYETMGKVKTGISDAFDSDERRVFTKRSLALQGLMSFFTAIPFAVSLFYAFYTEIGQLWGAVIASCISLVLILSPVYALGRLMRTWRGQQARKRTAKLVGCLLLLGIALVAYILAMLLVFYKPALGLAAVASTLILAWLSVFMRKRTDTGLRWLGQLMGLRSFIATAEKDRIEMLVKENPQYFYKILPYAYVLGVSETWARNFEKIGIQPEPPGWYRGYNMNLFTTMWLMSSLNHSMNSMGAAMVSRPAPSGGSGGFGGGGFGGGGGFSGGGFGGGGGGGW